VKTVENNGKFTFSHHITKASGGGRRPPADPVGVDLPPPGDDAPDDVKRLAAAGWVRVLYPVRPGVVDQRLDESIVRWELRPSWAS
jgi:hypothetical protein